MVNSSFLFRIIHSLVRRMSLQTRGRRPSMFDPIDPKELQQALYASAAAVSQIISLKKQNRSID